MPRALRLPGLLVCAFLLGGACGGSSDQPEWVQELETERPRVEIGGDAGGSTASVTAGGSEGTAPGTTGPADGPGDEVEPFPIDPRGDDFDTIWRELQAFDLWLLSNPDPALAAMVYVEGSELHAAAVDLLTAALERQVIIRMEGSRVVSVDLVERPDDRTARLRYVDTRQARLELDARTGEELQRETYPDQTWVWDAVIEADESGRWHMASIDFVEFGPPFQR
jgi:hypothetical protein